MKALKGIEGEIIVIDNNSEEGSLDFLKGRFPSTRFILNQQNEGFAKANNRALEIATGDYVLFLNPDTLLPEDCLSKCMAYLQSFENNGALGVKMINGSGVFLKESKRSFPDPATSLFKLSGLTSLFPRSPRFARYYLGHLDENKNHEAEVLSGAFMMIPRKILQVVKGFDPDFFMYGEDIDLSYRIRQAGFSTYYFSETTIIHFKGESTQKDSLKYVNMFYDAMHIFVKKHFGNPSDKTFQTLLRAGVLLRSALSAAKRAGKQIGRPLLDLLLAGLAWLLINKFGFFFLDESPTGKMTLSPFSFLVFSVLFLLCAFSFKLYKGEHKLTKLISATGIAGLLFYYVNSKFSESQQSPTEVLSLLVVFSFVFMCWGRWMLTFMGLFKGGRSNAGIPILVVGNEIEYREATKFIQLSDQQENIPSRVDSLNELLATPLTKAKVIFCIGHLTMKEIIDKLPTLPSGIQTGFFMLGCHSIISGKEE